MRNVKNALLILLVVLLLAAGSLLPMGAAALQDKTTANVVQYEDIEALQLKLEEQEPKLSYQEKLFLMVNGTGVDVAEDVMRLNGGEVIEAAYAALQPYADIYGLTLDNDALEYSSLMVFNENDPSAVSYYWSVYMSLDISQNDVITVILDDETGKLLAVELIDQDMDIAADYLQKMQYAVSTAYLEELGLEPVAEWPVEAESALYFGMDEGGAQIATRYQFIDARYGEIIIEICAHSDGFYIVPL